MRGWFCVGKKGYLLAMHNSYTRSQIPRLISTVSRPGWPGKEKSLEKNIIELYRLYRFQAKNNVLAIGLSAGDA